MIRKLKIEDAWLMHEWMKDEKITKSFSIDFSKFCLKDCERFIKSSIINYSDDKPKSLNFAITDETDDYKGTVSLKNIDFENNCAEFAIILVSSAHGTGLAKNSFDKIIEYAFNNLNLEFIYFSCKKENMIANKFYAKTNANLIDYDSLLIKLGKGTNINKIIGYNQNEAPKLLWYWVSK